MPQTMKTTLTTLLILFSFSFLLAQEPIEIGTKYKIDSKVLQEEREVWLALPANYDPQMAYPVLYVLDAEWQFDIARSLTKELAWTDQVPPHIVVGIPHIDYRHRFMDLTFSGTEFNSKGEKDATAADAFNPETTGGGMNFYRYLTEEVMEFVNAKHRTNGFDVLVGHSLGGYFGAYVLPLEGPFNAYQLFDASIWYNKGDAINHLVENAPEKLSSNVFIATAAGGEDRAQYNVDTQRKFHESLEEMKVSSVLHVYEDEDHGSVRLPGLIDGLTDLYEGVSFGYIFPTDTVTVADAKAHYQAFSEKVNHPFACPVDVYRWIGFANFTQEKWGQAIEAYELCNTLFDTDANVLREFGECLYQTNEFPKSLEMFEKALGLDPENETIQDRIKELGARGNNK